MIKDELHEKLQQARQKYFDVTRYLPPEANVAYLPEHQELQQVLLMHHAQCGCESNPYRNYFNLLGQSSTE